MKKLFTTIIACLAMLAVEAQIKQSPTLYAHRGCWTMSESGEFIVPENSHGRVFFFAGTVGLEQFYDSLAWYAVVLCYLMDFDFT